jgi:hypothetical protein
VRRIASRKGPAGPTIPSKGTFANKRRPGVATLSQSLGGLYTWAHIGPK